MKLQVSLRTLLLFVVTLLCVCVGWHDASMLGNFFTIQFALAFTVFKLGAPLWPWLMHPTARPDRCGPRAS